jgi:hypothetical protein
MNEEKPRIVAKLGDDNLWRLYTDHGYIAGARLIKGGNPPEWEPFYFDEDEARRDAKKLSDYLTEWEAEKPRGRMK